MVKVYDGGYKRELTMLLANLVVLVTSGYKLKCDIAAEMDADRAQLTRLLKGYDPNMQNKNMNKLFKVCEKYNINTDFIKKNLFKKYNS